MKIQVVVFWVVILYSVVVGHQRFGGPCCFHLQGGSKVLHGVTTQKSMICERFLFLTGGRVKSFFISGYRS
jgi:hypothetical protein